MATVPDEQSGGIALIEVGSYKGGGAIHISNSCPDRTIFVCDTFEEFGDLPIDPSLDHLFARERFRDTTETD
jgi:hypothetical protein